MFVGEKTLVLRGFESLKEVQDFIYIYVYYVNIHICIHITFTYLHITYDMIESTLRAISWAQTVRIFPASLAAQVGLGCRV